jgi:hypothetical protein
MAIDMKALRIATQGDPEAKLTVKRSWLKEVHKLLEEANRTKIELEALKAAENKSPHGDFMQDMLKKYFKGKPGYE